jgi:hypothetical protein
MDDCTYLFVLFFFLKKSFSTFPKEKHFDRCDAKEGKRCGRVVGGTAAPPLLLATRPQIQRNAYLPPRDYRTN